jgi:hypothetical protein
LEIVTHPHIVIACKKMHFDFLHHSIQPVCPATLRILSAQPPIFVPKVKHITNEKDFAGTFLYFIKELHDHLFSFEAGFVVRSTEMKVGKKVNIFLGQLIH